LRRPLNLARRPLRNERLPTVLLAVGCVVLAGVTVRHALLVRDLLPERTSAVDGELVALENELGQLRQERVQLEGHDVPPETLSEWAAVRLLVDHRTFSWSALMGLLEEVTPPGIRLTSITPSGESGRVEIRLLAEGRSVKDGLDFLHALQARQEFQDPFLNSVSESDESIQFDFTVGYVPAPRPVEETS
jgi:Tfp pilus assembly protein PilN